MIRVVRKSALLLAMFIAVPASGQTDLKVNAPTTVLGVPHVGIETVLSDRLTLQLDVAASLWRSINGIPFEMLMVIPEVRYHFRPERVGPYVGAHVGAAGFRLQKWNYFGTDLYQEGFSALIGVTFGYKRRLNDQWMLDWFIGGGTQQGAYRGYDASTDQRYEDADGPNKSGEWLPYRGGVMLTYALRPGKR